MLIGSHVSMSGKDMLLGAAKEAYSYNEKTFMIYTGAPQNTRRKDIADMRISEGQEYMKEHDLTKMVVHAPYIINLANNKDLAKYEFTMEFLSEEIRRATALGATQITLHPGSHVGLGAEEGIKNIAYGLNQILTKDQIPQIALETMAGKGTEIGSSFEELAQIMDQVKYNDKLSVTIDTCHMHDAGYDLVNDFDGVMEEFDRIIGIDKIKVVHLNDSKNECGAHKDRHENIGFGHIGFKTLHSIATDKRFEHLPKILETPYVGEDKKTAKAPYKYEIEMIKSGQFDEDLKNKIIND